MVHRSINARTARHRSRCTYFATLSNHCYVSDGDICMVYRKMIAHQNFSQHVVKCSMMNQFLPNIKIEEFLWKLVASFRDAILRGRSRWVSKFHSYSILASMRQPRPISKKIKIYNIPYIGYSYVYSIQCRERSTFVHRAKQFDVLMCVCLRARVDCRMGYYNIK